MPYYPKEYALREVTQLYSFTGLKVIQNHSHTEKKINEQDNVHHESQIQKQSKTQNNLKRQTQKYLKKKEKTGK